MSWITATAGIITTEGFDLMRNSLMNNFGEECYRSCEVMSSLREPSVHLQQTFDKLTEGKNTVFIYLFRYFMILLVGFLPLLILLKFSSLKIKFLNFKRLFLMKLLRPMVRLLLLSLRVFNLTNMCRARYAATLVATSVLLFLHVPLYYRTGKEFTRAENNSKERHLQHVLFTDFSLL